jgi:hypothetical protein
MSTEDSYWIAECTDCCWQSSNLSEYRAEDKADAHTEDTGHKTAVSVDE